MDGHLVGDADHDNTRVLNERRFLMEKIGDESAKCPVGYGNMTSPILNQTLLKRGIYGIYRKSC